MSANFTKDSTFNKDSNFQKVRFASNVPLLEVELNEMQDIQNEARASLVREQVPSGFLKLSDIEYLFNPNQIKLKDESVAIVNGYKITIPAGTIITLNNPDILNTRDDLVFLEVWFEEVDYTDTIYKYGGEGQETLTNEILDSRAGIETTRRVQLKWRLRVVDNVDFSQDEEGLTLVNAKAQLDNESSVKFVKDTKDVGLYVAEDSTLGYDNKCYAIPMFKVHRRPSCGYMRSNEYNKVYPLGNVKNLWYLENATRIAHVSDNGQVSVTVKGRTYTNLLGSDGDCEDTSKFTPYHSQATLDSTNKVFGNNSIKITIDTGYTLGSIDTQDLLSKMKQGSYYFASAYLKNGNATDMYLVYNGVYDTTNVKSSLVSDNNFKRVGLKISPTYFDTASSAKLGVVVEGTEGQYGYVDGVMLVEITEEEYNNLTVDELLEKYPYVSGTKSTNSVRVKSVGKNLIYSAYKAEDIGSNVEVLSDSSFKVTNDDYNGKKWTLKVKPNTTYILQFKQKDYTDNAVYLQVYDSVGNKLVNINAGLADYYYKTFTTLDNDLITIEIRTGGTVTNKTFYDIQLEEGDTATEYEPYKESVQYITLPDGVDGLHSLPNGVKDEITEDGRLIKKVEQETITETGAILNTTLCTNIDLIAIPKPSNSYVYGNKNVNSGAVYIPATKGQSNATGTSSFDDVANIGKFTCTIGDSYIHIGVTKGLYADISSAMSGEGLTGTPLIYQLAEPVIYDLNLEGDLYFTEGTYHVIVDCLPSEKVTPVLNAGNYEITLSNSNAEIEGITVDGHNVTHLWAINGNTATIPEANYIAGEYKVYYKETDGEVLPDTTITVGSQTLQLNGQSIGTLTLTADDLPYKRHADGAIDYVDSNSISDRPDGLFANIINERDILDLRHKVSLTGFNYQKLLEENFDKLLRGELQTKEKTKMKKTYFGIPKTPIDEHTVFYASFDGTTIAEVGGSLSDLSNDFIPMPTGLGIKFNLSYQELNINTISPNEGTVDFYVNTDELFRSTINETFFSFLNTNGYNALRITYGYTSKKLYVALSESEGDVLDKIVYDISNYKGYLHIRITWKLNNSFNLYINGVKVTTVSYNQPFLTPTKLVLGAGKYNSTSYYYNCSVSISDFMISNIDRGSIFATLPQDFINGYAEIVPAFNEQRRVYADPLTSQYTVDIIKPDGSNTERHIEITQATAGQWSAGDTIKIKGLTGELITGVIDSDTVLARVVEDNNSDTTKVKLDDVSALAVDDQIAFYDSSLTTYQGNRTITAIDTTNNIITLDSALTLSAGMVAVEITSSSSSPVVKFNNAGTLTTVTGTWSGLGTNEATFTLSDPATDGLTTEDIQIEYSVNYPAGQGKVPVYSEVKMAEINGKRLIPSNSITIVDDFKGKVSGSTVECPHTFKLIQTTSLLSPYDNWTEQNQGAIDSIKTLDGTLSGNSYNSANGMALHLFSFNLIEIVERKFGKIQAVDKIQWLKDNITLLKIAHYGYGVNPNGNFIKIEGWNNDINDWSAWGGSYASHTNDFVSQCYFDLGTDAPKSIDDNGFVHAVVYTDPSDGVTPSTVYTDYVSIEITLKSSAYTSNGYKILAPENNRAREDMDSGILLVRPETKEVERYPLGKADEYSNIVLYGDYVPYQCYDNTNSFDKWIMRPIVLFSTLGTGGRLSSTYNSSPWRNLLWNILADNLDLYNYNCESIIENGNNDFIKKIMTFVPTFNNNAYGGCPLFDSGTSTFDMLWVDTLQNFNNKVAKVANIQATLILENEELALMLSIGYFTTENPAYNDVKVYKFKLQGKPLIKEVE
ncbi:MAG: hypothetical protein H0Z24_05975 [Thermosipho sp. (in: Bacteria)]|nr:hypothetical protein [Thermosipho sp. (in: thermotogales)]